MKLKTKILSIILIYILSLSNMVYAIEPPPTQQEISGEAAILMEYETAKVLYEKNINQKMFPASTTKTMTALIALEKLDLKKKIVVPKDFPHVDGSSMYLLPEEEFLVEDLIKALLIHSSNDVAVLLAMNISGTIDEFCKLMNQRAKDIGCTSTNFTNPHGLHDDNHYTTVYDMALISREAMKNEEFKKIVAQPVLILPETTKTPEKRIYNNTNRFLWSNELMVYKNQYTPIKYDVVDGIKTGFTLEAQKCLSSTGMKNGIRMIAVVYKTKEYEVFRDSRRLLDYGFDNFKTVNLIESMKEIDKEPIKYSVQKQLSYAIKENVSYVSKIDEQVPFTLDMKFDELKLPIKKGQKIGTLTVNIQDSQNSYNLVALNDVDSIFTFKYLKELFTSSQMKDTKNKIIFVVISILFLLIILRFAYVIIKNKKRRNRYKKYR